MSEDLLTRSEGGVLWITLNRPESGNAVTPSMRDRLIALLEEAGRSGEVRAVVLAGSGKAFCTGADLRGPRAEGERPVGSVARTIRAGAQRLIEAILDCPKPVVAAVNGTAAGLGAHLAWAADLVVASSEARFIEVFVRRGLAPDAGGAYLLPRLVGLRVAKELIFLGDDLPAAEALRLGLVNRVVAPERLEAAVAELAGRLAAGPTVAIGFAKWLCNRSFDSDRTTAFEEEAYAQELVVRTEDAAEGIRSFLERRPPTFKGR